MAFPGDFPENQQSPPMYKTLVPESPKTDKRIKAHKFSSCLYTTYFVHHIILVSLQKYWIPQLPIVNKMSSIHMNFSMWFSCKLAKPFVFLSHWLVIASKQDPAFTFFSFLKLQQLKKVSGFEFAVGFWRSLKLVNLGLRRQTVKTQSRGGYGYHRLCEVMAGAGNEGVTSHMARCLFYYCHSLRGTGKLIKLSSFLTANMFYTCSPHRVVLRTNDLLRELILVYVTYLKLG